MGYGILGPLNTLKRRCFWEVSYTAAMSDETAKLIDQEIRKLIDNAENHARKVLKKNLKHLHNLAKALLEFETLSGDELKELINKGKIKSHKSSDSNSSNRKTSIPLNNKDKKKKSGIGINPKPLTT